MSEFLGWIGGVLPDDLPDISDIPTEALTALTMAWAANTYQRRLRQLRRTARRLSVPPKP